MSAVRFLPAQNKPGRTHSWLPLMANCVGSFWQYDGHCLECRDTVLLTTIALHGSFHEKETLLDGATLALDRCESQAKPPTLAIKKQELQEHVSDLQDVEQFKDREPAIGEMSRTFMCVSDQHHVSEAVVEGRIF